MVPESPQPPQQPFAIPTMQKQYAISVPFDPDALDTPTLKMMLIPLKAVVSEVNQYIQKLEQAIRNRR